jgi:hypothetical protein
MKLNDVTALARTIDPSYPTNRAIAALTIFFAIAGTALHVLSGGALLEGALWGVRVGFVLFLTWALGRELDPDHDLSAFVGVGLILIALLSSLDRPTLVESIWLLLLLRLVNHTTGLPAKPLDSLMVAGLGIWLSRQGNWVAGLATGAAFLLDGLLSPPLRYHRLVSGLVFLATLALSMISEDITVYDRPSAPVLLISAATTVLFSIVIATSRELQTVADETGKPLLLTRVRAAQVLALLTALLYALRFGESGVVAVLPLWAAMAGAGLYRLASLVLSRSR